MESPSSSVSRRTFLKTSSGATAGLALGWQLADSPVLGATRRSPDKIRMGFIGVGNRGTQLMHMFMDNPDVHVAALSDVYAPYLNRDHSQVDPRWLKELGGRVPKMGEPFGDEVKRYADYRQLLDDKEVDAVCIGTPDHWHARQTIDAIAAGKDIYVEKPLTIALKEGRRMIEAEAASDRMVQVGLNRRGSTVYQRLAKEVQGGAIGKVSMARAYRVSNMAPDGIGRMQPEDPPTGFDWNMWLGPRAYRPFQRNITPYKFRWWKDYSTQMGNWGVHYMDVCRWMMGEEAPSAISAHGSKRVVLDDRDIPDTMEVTFEFPSGAMITFGVYEANGGQLLPEGEVALYGSKADLACDDRGYQLTPTQPGQFQTAQAGVESEEFRLEKSEQADGNLIRNFLDCVKSRNKTSLWCNLETGHRSTSFAHLANIALETKTRIEWDARTERITNNRKANDLLDYRYRKPWA